MRVEDRLRHAAAPDADGAQERARRVVLAAAPAVEPRRRRAVLPVLLAALVAGVALTPPGDAVARWIRDLVEPSPSTRTTVGALPGGGRLLATGADGTFLVDSAGRGRRISRAHEAAWSPHGLFVAVGGDGVLRAVEPDGTVRWTLEVSGLLSDPRWSPTGYRIAYRRDDDLRIVAGDGSGDHPLVDAVAEVPAAWRDGAANEVAVARLNGRAELWNADTGARVWSRFAGDIVVIGWTPRGRLVVLTTDRLLVLGGGSARVRSSRPLEVRAESAALSPDGSRLAIASTTGVDTLDLREGTRTQRRLVAESEITSVVWSPSGKHVLAGGGGHWYLIPARGGPVTVREVRGAYEGFAPADWCCG
jgi:dipeptidyl aminopeptidase/acylaminoacyl peptidase